MQFKRYGDYAFFSMKIIMEKSGLLDRLDLKVTGF